MITQPAPPRPTPKSINVLHACSINDLVGGSGSERSLRASSAFGLCDQAKAKEMGQKKNGSNGWSERFGTSAQKRMEGHCGARVAPPERIYPKCFVVGMTAHVVIIPITRSYWDGFVYGQRGPAFDLGNLRHDNGSAGRRADEMQSCRTSKWGIRQVTRCYTYPGGEILEALGRRQIQ